MNKWLNRIIPALKVGAFTAALAFGIALAPYALAPFPMTDAEVDHGYAVAGWWALTAFLCQFIRVLVFQKSKT
jgi:hypothetical protein